LETTIGIDRAVEISPEFPTVPEKAGGFVLKADRCL
jgi:hypothetical protein